MNKEVAKVLITAFEEKVSEKKGLFSMIVAIGFEIKEGLEDIIIALFFMKQRVDHMRNKCSLSRKIFLGI